MKELDIDLALEELSDSQDSEELPIINKSEGESESELIEDEEELEKESKIQKDEIEKPASELTQSPESDSMIFVVKVTTNKEEKAAEIIADKINKKKLNVYAVARPHGLRGYIFLEAPDRDNAEEAVFNLPYVKGIIPKVITYAEVKPMLEPVIADIRIEKNDIVEIVAEPFKKEKAKVVRINKQKGEAIVSLLGAAVPITVTVKLDNVRVIRREESSKEEDDSFDDEQ